MEDFKFTMAEYAGPVEVQMACKVINGLPRCTAVLFHVPDQTGEVPASVVRDFPFEDAIETAFSRAVSPSEVGPEAWAQMRERDHSIPGSALEHVAHRTRNATRSARKRGRTRYTEDFLKQVAEVYNLNVERYPTKAVRVEFDVSETTAQTYVRKARDAGFIKRPAQRTGRPPRKDREHE
jgi:hypothetical protein